MTTFKCQEKMIRRKKSVIIVDIYGRWNMFSNKPLVSQYVVSGPPKQSTVIRIDLWFSFLYTYFTNMEDF